jgi:hypothetical protein
MKGELRPHVGFTPGIAEFRHPGAPENLEVDVSKPRGSERRLYLGGTHLDG